MHGNQDSQHAKDTRNSQKPGIKLASRQQKIQGSKQRGKMEDGEDVQDKKLVAAPC